MNTETGNKTMVKICGLRRLQDAEAANRILPDLAGFILSPGYGRSIEPAQAMTLRRILSPEIRTVGVFIDASIAEIVKAAETGCINMIQLHGKEDDGCIREIAAMTGLPVIKAFRIGSRQDLETAASSAAKWILLDSGTGTGKRFDWDLLESFLHEQCGEIRDNLFPGGHRWLLAGGLSAENVASAIGRFCPTGVDVSSKVETDGFKDPEKMAAFAAAARAGMIMHSEIQ